MGFGFNYQYPHTSQKMSKSDHSLKSYKQIKCAIWKTAELLHAYLYLPRTSFIGYLIVKAVDYSVLSCFKMWNGPWQASPTLYIFPFLQINISV